ncbi:hypothetical protein N0V91_007727 [Didymella pomorum]|uniref:Uncharacterized protein n=1 Tax=Didymella pomorum TaxID=749634 RepID=A0A9W8ZA61_9PLEO|nr:hypothetical protein N0V91_007727 [Didymella pomorum]
MSIYHDLPTEELEALMYKVHGECDAASAATQASLAKCDKGVKKLETHLRDEKALIHRAELTLAEHTATVVAPHILAAYKNCRTPALKKANKQVTKAVESLTDQRQGKASPQEQALKNENEDLQRQLTLLQAQLASKAEVCEAKDAIIMSKQQDINYFCEDFAAYQSVHEDTWSHRHDGCNELSAALEEQCEMYKTLATTLEGNLNTFRRNLNSVAKECDYLREQFKDSIKAHRIELEDPDASKRESSQGRETCVVRLERTLRISRAGEFQALQLVDQVNHDRMVAWNQVHEHQTRVVQEHYVSIGAWVTALQ